MSAAPFTAEELRALFTLEEESGRIFWKSTRPTGGPVKAGTEAGHTWLSPNGAANYQKIKIDQKVYFRSKIVFCMVHGRWPHETIDHIDGNGLNDRPENLREANRFQNTWNIHRRMKRDLPMGVGRNDKSPRYSARIRCQHKVYHLGSFDTAEAAGAAYQAKRKELFGEFA